MQPCLSFRGYLRANFAPDSFLRRTRATPAVQRALDASKIDNHTLSPDYNLRLFKSTAGHAVAMNDRVTAKSAGNPMAVGRRGRFRGAVGSASLVGSGTTACVRVGSRYSHGAAGLINPFQNRGETSNISFKLLSKRAIVWLCCQSSP